MSSARIALVLLLAVVLVACGKKDARDAAGGALNGVADEALPTPASAPGTGVTGMPGARAPRAAAADNTALPAAVDDASDAPETPATEPAPVAEPTPQDAVALLRDYYGALNAGDFGRAYALWSDGGRASGQSLAQFTEGFAQTRGVSVEIGEPGAVEGAAGSRLVQLPVTLQATQRDGSQHRYAGSFTLRRAVVDGASDEQRAWRIASANLQEQ